MEFSPEGGVFLLYLPDDGKDMSVRVPWDVAAEGWSKETGRQTPNQEELRAWLQNNEARYSAMVAARLDPEASPATEADDPRVLSVEELRHI